MQEFLAGEAAKSAPRQTWTDEKEQGIESADANAVCSPYTPPKLCRLLGVEEECYNAAENAVHCSKH